MKIDAYPLQWPHGWKRTNVRVRSKFAKREFGQARDEMFRELKNLGVGNWNIIISSNIPLRKDGLPYSGMANPADPGVAVYFKFKGRDMVFACDTYVSAVDNMWAVAKTIECLRTIERYGASDMLERSFTGFQALPAPASVATWYDVLGVPKTATNDQIKSAWREKLKQHHPDVGGSQEKMIEINEAYKEGMAQR